MSTCVECRKGGVDVDPCAVCSQGVHIRCFGRHSCPGMPSRSRPSRRVTFAPYPPSPVSVCSIPAKSGNVVAKPALDASPGPTLTVPCLNKNSPTSSSALDLPQTDITSALEEEEKIVPRNNGRPLATYVVKGRGSPRGGYLHSDEVDEPPAASPDDWITVLSSSLTEPSGKWYSRIPPRLSVTHVQAELLTGLNCLSSLADDRKITLCNRLLQASRGTTGSWLLTPTVPAVYFRTCHLRCPDDLRPRVETLRSQAVSISPDWVTPLSRVLVCRVHVYPKPVPVCDLVPMVTLQAPTEEKIAVEEYIWRAVAGDDHTATRNGRLAVHDAACLKEWAALFQQIRNGLPGQSLLLSAEQCALVFRYGLGPLCSQAEAAAVNHMEHAPLRWQAFFRDQKDQQHLFYRATALLPGVRPLIAKTSLPE